MDRIISDTSNFIDYKFVMGLQESLLARYQIGVI